MTLQQIVSDLPWHRRIEVLRIAKGWSQEEAAKKCGTNQKGYWLWEKGKTSPRRNSKKAISKAFGVSVKEIFGDEV